MFCTSLFVCCSNCLPCSCNVCIAFDTCAASIDLAPLPCKFTTQLCTQWSPHTYRVDIPQCSPLGLLHSARVLLYYALLTTVRTYASIALSHAHRHALDVWCILMYACMQLCVIPYQYMGVLFCTPPQTIESRWVCILAFILQCSGTCIYCTGKLAFNDLGRGCMIHVYMY